MFTLDCKGKRQPLTREYYIGCNVVIISIVLVEVMEEIYNILKLSIRHLHWLPYPKRISASFIQYLHFYFSLVLTSLLCPFYFHPLPRHRSIYILVFLVMFWKMESSKIFLLILPILIRCSNQLNLYDRIVLPFIIFTMLIPP